MSQASSIWECWAPTWRPPPTAVRRTMGTGRQAPRHVAQLGGVVGELVQTQPEEVHEHDLGHRPQAAEGRTDGRAHDGLLGDGRVADPVGAVLGGEALGHAEDPVVGDVLAEQHHPVVGRQGLVERQGDGGADAHLHRPVGHRPLTAALAVPVLHRLRRHAAARHDVGEHLVGAGLGELEHLGQGGRPPSVAHRSSTAAASSSVSSPALDQDVAEAGHGLALPRLFELGGIDVGHAVAEDVPEEPVGHGLDEGRPLPGPGPRDRLATRRRARPPGRCRRRSRRACRRRRPAAATCSTRRWSAKAVCSPYPLFWHRKTTGSSHTAARLAASWKAPMLVAPSPNEATVTRPVALACRRPGQAGRDGQARADHAGGQHEPDVGPRHVHGAALALARPLGLAQHLGQQRRAGGRPWRSGRGGPGRW